MSSFSDKIIGDFRSRLSLLGYSVNIWYQEYLGYSVNIRYFLAVQVKS